MRIDLRERGRGKYCLCVWVSAKQARLHPPSARCEQPELAFGLPACRDEAGLRLCLGL